MDILYIDVLQEILARLSSTKDRIRFLWALGREYKPWLDLEIQRVIEWMIRQGAAIGWVYQAHFAPVIKAKRIAKKWKDSRYCQGCGRRSESSKWLHFVSTQTGKRLCTQCIKKEWDTHMCECGIPVSFIPTHSAEYGFSPSTSWRVECTVRKAWGAGSDFEQQITSGFFPSPNMRRQAEQATRNRELLQATRSHELLQRKRKRFSERNKEEKRATRRKRNYHYFYVNTKGYKRERGARHSLS
jgi:hypothetical protein